MGARSREAMTLVDWGGHNNNLGVVSSAKEVLEAARKNLTNILHSVSIDVLFHLKKNLVANVSLEAQRTRALRCATRAPLLYFIREGFQ